MDDLLRGCLGVRLRLTLGGGSSSKSAEMGEYEGGSPKKYITHTMSFVVNRHQRVLLLQSQVCAIHNKRKIK